MADLTRKTANLVDLPTWSNSITDTRVEFQLIVRLYRNGTIIGQNVFNITQTGYFSAYSVVAGSYFDRIFIKHNGSARDITIIDMPFDGKKNQQIWFSATALGVNPTAVGGLSFKDIMLNVGDSALPYEPYGWYHSLRKLTTATEAVENPLYSDGTAITAYNIKGNEEYTGTPTPSNPVEVNGVGVRTENLLNPNSKTTNQSGVVRFGGEFPAGTYYIYNGFNETIYYRDGVSSTSSTSLASNRGIVLSFTNALVVWHSSGLPTDTIMVAESSEAIPFEPYGQFKIPISSGGVTTNIYLGSTSSTRQIKKLVLTGQETFTLASSIYYGLSISPSLVDRNELLSSHFFVGQYSGALAEGQLRGTGTPSATILFNYDNGAGGVEGFKSYLAAQYANGTPVTVWYVFATAETAAVNEPLMKIGTYADTLSNAASIPTTEGANSITVDTTVQPSEFTATWTGWHEAEVKEKSENLFDATIEQGTITGQGADSAASNRVRTAGYTALDAGTYTLSFSTTGTGVVFVFLYDSSNNFVGRIPTDWANQPYTFTLDSNYKIRFAIKHPEETSIAPSDVTNIMLNEGSTALPYEPYWK